MIDPTAPKTYPVNVKISEEMREELQAIADREYEGGLASAIRGIIYRFFEETD